MLQTFGSRANHFAGRYYFQTLFLIENGVSFYKVVDTYLCLRWPSFHRDDNSIVEQSAVG